MKIAIGCDHGALALKDVLIPHLEKAGYEVKDFGTYTLDSCDYPDFAGAAAKAVASGECDRGIVLCTTGIGVSITANKIKGIRCATCSEPYSAELTRRHNNANMLAMGARVIGPELAKLIARTFLTTEFEAGGRHSERVAMLEKLERGEDLE